MKPCPSFPGYSSSADGRVFSHRRGRTLPGGGKMPMIDPSYARELSGTRTAKGYVTVGIRVADARSRPVGVHRLVADAFLGPCPEGQQVRHLDGDPTNNAATNIAYGTAADNAGDRMRHGRYAVGADHHGAKLTREQIKEVIALRADGVRVREIAQRFAVSVSTIEGVIYGKTYVEFRRVEVAR